MTVKFVKGKYNYCDQCCYELWSDECLEIARGEDKCKNGAAGYFKLEEKEKEREEDKDDKIQKP